jgi:UDP-glucose 4-epimerase
LTGLAAEASGIACVMAIQRIVVTGASGNVGTALLRSMVAAHPEWDVVGVCRRPPPAGDATYGRVAWRAIDVGAAESESLLADAFRDADAVVHAAWLIQPSRDVALLERTNIGGTSRVLSAARKAGVRHLIHLSSVGAYSPSSKAEVRDESWTTTGVPGSSYSREKAAAERLLDGVEFADTGLTITRMRPGLIFQRDAGSEIARYFLGWLLPQTLVGRARLPVLPLPDEATFQVVHAADVAHAIISALEGRVAGAFNLAADPVVTPERLARVFGARRTAVSSPTVRAIAAATYRLRLQPTEPGWVDLAFAAPIMDCSRARDLLQWAPAAAAGDVLAELFAGMRDRAGTTSSALRPPALRAAVDSRR